MNRPIVIIESPYAKGNWTVEENIEFAFACCSFALRLGYAPFASHLFYTQLLDDNIPAEREMGIACGYQFIRKADEVWFCFRPGEDFSPGMAKCHEWIKNYKPGARVKYMRFTVDGAFITTFDF